MTINRSVQCTFVVLSGLLFAVITDSSVAAEGDISSGAAGTGLTEIVVTAEKRSERIQDVPMAVTAISAESLLDSNLLTAQDYYSSVPGLSLVGAGGDASLSLRGISTGGSAQGFQNPTVGITIDDVPYGASNGLAFAGYIPDLDPNDLSRIEVLRGPQGTLYGASSIGGLLKYVTVDPSTAGVSGYLRGDVDSIHNADQPAYALRGSVNVPVNDTLAILVSGVTRRDSGYIDNYPPSVNPGPPSVGARIRDVNRVDVDGARASLLWKPSESFSLKVGALSQNTTAYGTPAVNGPLGYLLLPGGPGSLTQSVLPGTGGYDQSLRLYTANIGAKFGGIELAAVSGYGIYKTTYFIDQTNPYGGVGGYAYNAYGALGALVVDNSETKKFTQEIRLSSAIGQWADWLVGAFYDYENSDPVNQQVVAANASTGAAVGSLANFYFPTTYTEYAGFADLTLHFTDRFDVQFGGRESFNRQIYNETDTGILATLFDGATPTVFPTTRTKDNSFTYLVTPRFKMSSDIMAYARIASGYRQGGPNSDASLFHFPEEFAPDKTENYELGVKADLLNHALSIDAAAYYIDWHNIQLEIISQSTGYTFLTNASGAKSEGVELSGQAKPLDRLTISAWGVWNEAVLTAALPTAGNGFAYGNAGDRLPYSSRWSGNLSIEQGVPLTSDLTGFLGGSLTYVGQREASFAYSSSAPRVSVPSYTRTDLRAGVRHGLWTISTYVMNLTDSRGLLGAAVPPNQGGTYIQPRTVGLSITRKFTSDVN